MSLEPSWTATFDMAETRLSALSLLGATRDRGDSGGDLGDFGELPSSVSS